MKRDNLNKIEIVAKLSGRLSDAEVEDLLRSVKKAQLYEDKEIWEHFQSMASSSDAVSSFCFDANFFRARAKQLKEGIDSVNACFESSVDELFHTLLAYEQQLRKFGKQPLFGGFNTSVEIEFGDEALYRNSIDALAAFDHFISYFGITLRTFLGRESKLDKFSFASEKYDAACAHIPLSNQWAIFHEHRTIWEQGHAIGVHSETKSTFDATESEALSAFRISLSRLRSFRQVQMLNRFRHLDISPTCRVLPPLAFRSEDEARSSYMTCQQFYSEELMEEIHGAKLAEWVRAYTIIREIGVETIKARPVILEPDELLFFNSEAYFVVAMIDGGISERAARIIVQHFKFHSKAKDLLDAPLIPLNGQLVLAPSVASSLEPAFSIESLLKSIKHQDKNHDLQVIGPGFEKLTRKTLAEVGVVARKVKCKQFDCDVAFVLEADTLVLCECKGKFQVSDFKSYLDLEKYLTENACAQHQRTCDFFANNLHHVRNRLSLPHDWVPKRILKLVVTSAKLGRVRLSNDFYIIDENMFYGFFSRRKVAVKSIDGREKKSLPDARLDGPITTSAFIDYMENPPNIVRSKSHLETRVSEVTLNNRLVAFKDVECYGEVFFESPSQTIWTPESAWIAK